MSVDRTVRLAQEGFVVAEGVLDGDWCTRLHEAIERCRAAPSEHYAVLSAPGSARVDSDLFRWFDDPAIEELVMASPLPVLAAELLDRDEVVLIEDQWFCSEPGASTPSPWHQDDPYYNLDRSFLTIWITLDDVMADVALRVVPGSHSTGEIYSPVEFSATSSTIGAATETTTVPDIDADPDAIGVTSWELRAGDAIAIDSRLLHATGAGVIADRPFRRISTRWAEPETRYLDRGPQVANFWHLLPHGLESGDPVAGEVFPLLAPTS